MPKLLLGLHLFLLNFFLGGGGGEIEGIDLVMLGR